MTRQSCERRFADAHFPGLRKPVNRRHPVATIAASIEILSKQESLRIHCVRYDAGGFPERSTGPVVGSRKLRHNGRNEHERQTCPRPPYSRWSWKTNSMKNSLLAYFQPEKLDPEIQITTSKEL